METSSVLCASGGREGGREGWSSLLVRQRDSFVYYLVTDLSHEGGFVVVTSRVRLVRVHEPLTLNPNLRRDGPDV